MNQTAARPKNGRLLQNPAASKENGFVAAVPSREFRDGTGIFAVKLSLRPQQSVLAMGLKLGV